MKGHPATQRRILGSWLAAVALSAIVFGGYAWNACELQERGPGQSSYRKHENMKRNLKTGDLEQIRAAAIRFYEASHHEFRTAFVAELKRGVARVDSSTARIGIWVLEEREGKLVLMRQPPPSEVMYYFGLHLHRAEEDWSVEGDFVERDTTDIEPE